MKFSETDKEKARNVKGLFTNPSTRPIVFMTSGILIAVFAVSYLSMSKTADQAVQSGASTAAPPVADHTPGASTSASHNELQQRANQDRLNQARDQGSSYIPTITGSTSDVSSPLTLPSQPGPAQQQTPPPATVGLPTAPTQVLVPAGQPQGYQAQAVPAVNPGPSEALQKQVEGYLNMWGPRQLSVQEFVYSGKEMSEEQRAAMLAQQNGVQPGQQNGAALSAPAQPQDNNIRYVRAASVAPAMLITPLNSDTPGPVLAQITSGPLAGARLIGTMKLNKEAIFVEFNQISKPGWPDSYPVRAVGMDDRFSTALASDVNHHYFQRYLGMIGGAFLQGYGDALQQQGQSTVVTPGGGVVVGQNELDSRQVRRSAQGSVLSEVGSQWEDSADRPVTVKVEGKDGSPYPIRVLFMESF